ncbi:transglycosylase SLT domain-containing protein [Niveibacterium terrae]|uniref:transglycosylase SLT domain-containing protein n=1 Tax=Niveibacterium terrae TaxID=3373598 RepID=UPI003A8F1079
MFPVVRLLAKVLLTASACTLCLTVQAEDNEKAPPPATGRAVVSGSVAISQLDLSSQPNPGIATLDLTAEPHDLWDRMRHGFAMTDLNTQSVTNNQIAYLSRPAALRGMLERGSKYLYHIVEELEKRGMPTELALLPIVESAFNPMANSPAKASGLWQFIPSTGRDFNLAQNWWVDERRDVVASTNAALTYLQALYELHGDWHLALASYNWGENSVMRAVNRNKAAGLPTDFASLTMPAETRNYVPKLQALKNIIANPKMFGITLPEIPNQPYFATVTTEKGMDLATAARMAEMPVKDFVELNPSFNRPVIPGSGERKLILPKERVSTFVSNLESQNQPLLNWQTYSTRNGERIEQIAARFGISAEKLRAANGLPARSRMAAGYTLLVPNVEPQDAAEAAHAPQRIAPPQAEARSASTGHLHRNANRGDSRVKEVRTVKTRASGKTRPTVTREEQPRSSHSNSASRRTSPRSTAHRKHR